jgi:hypothetical protein
MNPQKRTLKKLAAFALAVGSAVAVGSSATQANGGWTVSGTVTTADDGAPLAGVEVFLWVDAGTPPGPRYTCTDESGDYSFDDVVTYMMVATGPEVYPSEPCDNSAFLDYRTRPTSALLVQFDGPYFPSGVTLTESTTVDLEVEGLPGSLPQLDRLAVNAMTACWLHGDADGFTDLMANYDKLYDKHSARVDSGAAEQYAWFSDSIWPIFSDGVVCPPGIA